MEFATRKDYIRELITRAFDGRFPAGYADTSRKDVGGFVCQYRDIKGNACAGGILIPDEKYVPTMEKKTINAVTHDYPGSVNIPPGINPTSFQLAHDVAAVKAAGGANFAQEFIKNLLDISHIDKDELLEVLAGR